MFNKVKSFVNQHKTGVKYICTTAVVTGMTALAPVVAFADEASPDVRTQLKSSATSVATDIMGTITDVLPIVLPIMGAILVVGIGISVVKKVTKKSSSG